MNYPLISDYIEALASAEDNFDQLKNLRPVLDDDGNPIMSSGNYAVVFKMQDSSSGEYFAVKCFIRDEPLREENYYKISASLKYVDSPYILKVEYLRNELFVNTNQSDETEYPILKMPWVEGQTMGKYISENYDNSFLMAQLAYNFCKLGSWLLSQDFAHGDLKPDNIIIKDNGMPVLVDYDGMYVPEMHGQHPQEIGSPGFRHPSRVHGTFNEHIDDFAIAVIALSLQVLSKDSSAFFTMKENDYSLFSEEDYSDISQSNGMKHLLKTAENESVKKLWGLLLIALAVKDLSSVSFRLIQLPLPSIEEDYHSQCIVTDNDLAKSNSFSPIRLDKSKRRLLKYKSSTNVIVPEGVEIVCDRAIDGSIFHDWTKTIDLPESLKAIGSVAFANNTALESITIPRGVEYIEPNNPFGGCTSLSDIQVLSPKFVVKDHCLYKADYSILYSSLFGVTEDVLIIHPNTKTIAANAFWGQKISKVVLPKGIKVILRYSFAKSDLQEINLPDTLEIIKSGAFRFSKLKTVRLPDSIKELGSYNTGHYDGVFCCCKHLVSAHLPSSLSYIGGYCFLQCTKLRDIELPQGLVSIGSGAFWGCSNLQNITLPSTLVGIGDRAFLGSGFKSIRIPEKVSYIGKHAFSDLDFIVVDHNNSSYDSRENCNAIIESRSNTLIIGSNNTFIPTSVTSIADYAFSGCRSLLSLHIPDSITTIGKSCYFGCDKITHLTFPASVIDFLHSPDKKNSILEGVFERCTQLKTVTLRSHIPSLMDSDFTGCTSLSAIIVPKGHKAKYINQLSDKYYSLIIEEE